MRKLLDGSEVAELATAKTLEVVTKCPEKWMLVDLETGERYIGHTTNGPSYWNKVNTTRTLT